MSVLSMKLKELAKPFYNSKIQERKEKNARKKPTTMEMIKDCGLSMLGEVDSIQAQMVIRRLDKAL